jgi:hypothetical protein
MESGPILAILLTLVVHVLGMGLLYAMLGREMLEMFRSKDRPDWGDGGDEPADEPVVSPQPSGGGLPLPDAFPAAVRMREPGRLAEHCPRRIRRPEHAPQPPVRTPDRA